MQVLQEQIFKLRPCGKLLEPLEAAPWQGDAAEDLVTLSQRRDFDIFTACLIEKIFPWLVEKSYQRFKVSPIHEQPSRSIL